MGKSLGTFIHKVKWKFGSLLCGIKQSEEDYLKMKLNSQYFNKNTMSAVTVCQNIKDIIIAHDEHGVLLVKTSLIFERVIKRDIDELLSDLGFFSDTNNIYWEITGKNITVNHKERNE